MFPILSKCIRFYKNKRENKIEKFLNSKEESRLELENFTKKW
jgi:hypothetical protein